MRESTCLWGKQEYSRMFCVQTASASKNLPPWLLWVFEPVTPGLEWVVI